MPYFYECQINTSSPFGDGEGKCGKPVPEGYVFPACTFHLQHIHSAPDNPRKSFPDSAKCIICGCVIRGNLKGSICCRIEEHKDNITLSALIKLFHEDTTPGRDIFMGCDIRVINALKDYLVEKVPSLPRNFTVSFDRIQRIIIIHQIGTRKELHAIKYNIAYDYVRDYPITPMNDVPPPYTPSQDVGEGAVGETLEIDEMTYTIHVFDETPATGVTCRGAAP